MKIFEIDDDTGEQVEVDENGNPLPQTSSKTEPPPVQDGATKGRYEPPPPPKPVFASFNQSPFYDECARPLEETRYRDSQGQQSQFVPQKTQQRDYQQELRNEQRYKEERFAEMLAQPHEQLNQQRAQDHPQQRAEYRQAQAEQQFRYPVSPRNPFANGSFLRKGAGVGIGTSQGFPGLRGPRGGNMPFGAAVPPAQNEFLDPRNAGSAAQYVHAEEGHYSAPVRGHAFSNGAPGSRYQGENQHRGTEKEPGTFESSDRPFSDTQSYKYPADRWADGTPELSNPNPTGYHQRRSDGRRQQDGDQSPA